MPILGTKIDKPDLKGLKWQPTSAFGNAFKDGLGGNLINIPFIAMEVGSAQRGEQVSTLTGKAIGIASYPFLAGVVALGVGMIPGVNVAAAGLVASVIAMYPNSLFEGSTTRGINWLNQTGKNIRHLEMGGKYVDSDYAAHQRQISRMEMSSAQGANRRYLGNEALIAHR